MSDLLRDQRNPINLPSFVEKPIGFDAWTALSWALHQGWVKDYKWYFSQMIGRDLGTPFTVRLLLWLENGLILPGRNYYFFEAIDQVSTDNLATRDLLLFSNRVDPAAIKEFYQLLVEGYLLGTDFISSVEPVPDQDGANQLEGELRRYWAKRTGVSSQQAILTKEVVEAYCTFYELPGSAYRLSQKLNLLTND